MSELFRRISRRTSNVIGSPTVFVIALGGVLLWAVLGPVFHYSDTWQLVINTTTTIITFLVVFMIQNTQNRDSRAVHLKLDELIRVIADARNVMVDAENFPDAELKRLQREFHDLQTPPGSLPRG
jgi:low affinity Fe/Cu permease